MKFTLAIALILLFCAGLLFADQPDERVWGPNLLRSNPEITTYSENAKSIPTYVEGRLLTDKAVSGAEFATALKYFEINKNAYRMESPTEELTLRRIDTDKMGLTHVRIDQVYEGLPVIGGNLIAHFTKSKELKTVNGYFFNDIALDITAQISAGTAVVTASEDLKSFFGDGEASDPELVVFPWEDEYYLCWRMFLYSDTPMGRWEYFIDAHTGAVVFNANRIMNENDIGTGIGVMGDTRDHIDTRLNGSVYEMKDYTRRALNNPHGHDGQMAATAYIQTNLATTSLPGSIATDADNYWDEASLQRPAVDGQVYTGLVYDYLLGHFGRNGFDDNGSSMLTSVNYSAEGDNNAYWNGNQIVIWSWSSGWRSLAACPDVIAHEWGHAVTETASNLVYQKEPGALNESFSDMIGAAFEFAYPDYDTPDWGMGENGRTTGVPFRSMSDPHLYGDPDYYGPTDGNWVDVENCTPSYLNDYCGVHTNSGVGNKWYFLLSDGGTHHDVTVTGIGSQNAILVAYYANLNYWTSNTDYHQAALGTISAANDLDPSGAWALQVSNAWNAVGVETPGPSFTFTYPDGIPSILVPDQDNSFDVVIEPVLGGVLVSGSPTLHYSLNGGTYTTSSLTQLTATRFRITLPADSCGTDYSFYVSAEESASGEKYDTSPSTPHTAKAADNVLSIFTDNFETNLGWTVSGTATDGQWTRGVPVGLGERGDPATDFDGSGSCYLTDNVYGNSDVDGGTTNLDSPTFDLSGGDALIHYARWYSNNFGDDPYNDVMKVYISNNNGSLWTLVETIGPSTQASGGWFENTFTVSDFVTPTDQMKVRFEASDLGSGSVVEAAVDDFSVTQFQCGSIEPLDIVTTSVPDWTAGEPLSQQLESTGGQGGKTWSDLNGDLAGTGLTLSATGLLSGTPTSAAIIGFTARVEDSQSAFDEQYFTFSVNAALSITTVSLPAWTVGLPYQQQLTVTGGTGSHAWGDKNGDLTGTGLALSALGEISGTPSAAATVNFTAEVTDDIGATSDKVFSILINPAVAIVTESLPEVLVGDAYNQQLQSTGGTGSIAWTDNGNGLNGSGLLMSAAGEISGTPTVVGIVSLTARATDAVGAYTDKALTIDVMRGYVCGDASGDGSVDIGDAVFLISYVFREGSAPDPVAAGDANCDGDPNVADAVYIINYVFRSGPEPCCP